MERTLTNLIEHAPWREAVTFRDTWPHEYVLSEKDGQQELLNAIYPLRCPIVADDLQNHRAKRSQASQPQFENGSVYRQNRPTNVYGRQNHLRDVARGPVSPSFTILATSSNISGGNPNCHRDVAGPLGLPRCDAPRR